MSFRLMSWKIGCSHVSDMNDRKHETPLFVLMGNMLTESWSYNFDCVSNGTNQQ